MQDWNWFASSDLTKGQETKIKIMKGAIRLFSQDGFNHVTLKEIARETATSHPLILKHFESKENLLLAVRKYVSFNNHTWVDAKIKNTMDGVEALRTHCYENINWGFHHRDQAKIILLTYYYSSLDGSNGKTGQRAFKLGGERVYRYVQQAEREGLLPKTADSKQIAAMIHEYAVGLFIKMLATEGAQKKRLPRSFKEKLDQVIDRILV